MIKAVEVAEAVEVEIAKIGVMLETRPAIENFAKGEVVPIPKLPSAV
jgi:hypothetical protein